MATINIDTGSYETATIQIKQSDGTLIEIPWARGLTTAPLISRSERLILQGLASPGTTSGGALYADIFTRFNQLRSILNKPGNEEAQVLLTTDGNTVSLTPLQASYSLGWNNVIFSNVRSLDPLQEYEKGFLEFMNAQLNVHGGVEGWYVAMTDAETIPRRRTVHHDAARVVNSNNINSQVTALDRQLGDPGVSLQIGYLSWEESELGPDSIVFSDLFDVQTAGTLRSDTDVAIKGFNGRSFLDIDIIFPGSHSINTKFRPLIGMLKMAPVIPIGGAAVSAVLINQLTATEVYEELKSAYFDISAKSKDDEDTTDLELAMGTLTDQAKMTLKEVTDLWTGERDAMIAIRKHLDYVRRREDQVRANRFDDIETPDPRDIATNTNVRTLLIPMAFNGMTVSTISASPGALRVRLSFSRYSDAYNPAGGMAFIDHDGNPTFDMKRCTPLIDAVTRVFLHPLRPKFKADGGFQMDYNKDYYIPEIGDKFGDSRNIAGVARARVTYSEFGHTLYTPLGAFGKTDVRSTTSPILIRYSNTAKPFDDYEYVPNDLVVESIVWNYQNKIATIPIEGQVYPSFQHLGVGSSSLEIRFQTTSRRAIQKFMTVKGSMDGINSYDSHIGMLRREYCDIHNDVVNLSGFRRFIIQSARVEVDPNNKSLYHLIVSFVGNTESSRTRETLQSEETLASEDSVNEFWWWMYAGLLIKLITDDPRTSRFSGTQLNSHVKDLLGGSAHVGGSGSIGTEFTNIFYDDANNPRQFGDISLGRENSSHTRDEVELIWKLVFGYNDSGNDNEYVIGIVEQDLLLASMLEMIMDGEVGGKGFSGDKFFKDRHGNFNVPSFLREGSHDLASWLQWSLRKSREVPIDNSFLSKWKRSSSGEAEYGMGATDFMGDDGLEASAKHSVSWKTVFEAIRSWYSRTEGGANAFWYEAESKSFRTRGAGQSRDAEWNLFSANTPAFQGAHTHDYFDNIIATMDDDPHDVNAVKWSMIRRNTYGVFWIPTPQLWAKMLKLLKRNRHLHDKGGGNLKGQPYGYKLYHDGISSNHHAFVLTDTWKQRFSSLKNMLSNPDYQVMFPTFWKRLKNNEIFEGSNYKLYSGSDLADVKINPLIYDNRNNYLDIPLPRYSEIFGENVDVKGHLSRPSRGGTSRFTASIAKRLLGDSFSAKPRTDPRTNVEVWRKVAPSYAELGVIPNVYHSILGSVTTDNQLIPKSPALVTPRSFNDFCDPGFFYYKKSWIAEKYHDVLDSIKRQSGETDDIGSSNQFNALGGNDDFTMDAKEKLENINRYGGSASTQPMVHRTNFSINEALDIVRRNQGGRVGVTVTAPNVPVNEKDFGTHIVETFRRHIRETLKLSDAETAAGGEGVLLTQMETLAEFNKKQKRILAYSNEGKLIGSIVAVRGKLSETRLGSAKGIFPLNATSRELKKVKRSHGVEWYLVINPDLLGVNGKPRTINYQDATGTLKYNVYDPKSAQAVLRSTLESASDLRTNHIRAYPTFRLYFVREKLISDTVTTYLEDVMFGYSSVIGLDVVIDKEDAATAVVTVTDISGVLSTSVFKKDVYDPKKEIKPTNDVIELPDADIQDQAASESPHKLMLEIGTNILIKMGYGNDPDTLHTVFTGSIAEITPGPITTIVAQGYKTELLRRVNFLSDSGWFEQKIDEVFAGEYSTPQCAAYLVLKILQLAATVPGSDKMDRLSGIPHFGRFFSIEEYKRLGKPLKTEASHIYFHIRKIYEGSSDTPEMKKLMQLHGTGVPASRIRTTNATNRIQSFFQATADHFLHTNAMRNVFFSTEGITDGYWARADQKWLIDGTAWDALKEVTRYRPGYICQVVPYGPRATLFMGRPSQLYHYKPVNQRELKAYGHGYPLAKMGLVSTVFNGFILDYLASEEYGLTNVERAWTRFAISTGGLGIVIGPLGVSTPTSAPRLSDYVKQLLLIIEAQEREGARGEWMSSMRSLDALKDVSPIFDDPSILPSYGVARYIVSKINKRYHIRSKQYRQWKANNASVEPGSLFDKNVDITAINKELIGGQQEVIFVLPERVGVSWGSFEDLGSWTLGEDLLSNISYGAILNPIAVVQENLDSGSNISGATNPFPGPYKPIDFFNKGYEHGDYFALYKDGRIVPKDILSSQYDIFVNGRGWRRGSADETLFGTSAPNSVDHPTFGNSLNRIVVATPLSSALIRFGSVTDTASNLDVAANLLESYGTKTFDQPFVDPILSVRRSMILTMDRSQDLSEIQSMGDNTLLKALFALYFGLNFTEFSDRSEGLLEFPKTLNDTWLNYTKIVMKGHGYVDSVEERASLTGPDSNAEIEKLFDDALHTAVAPLSAVDNSIPEPRVLQYGDVATGNRNLDPDQLDRGVSAMETYLRQQVINGSIPVRQFNEYRQRLKKFVEQAINGSLAMTYASQLGTAFDNERTLDVISRFVTGAASSFDLNPFRRKAERLHALRAEIEGIISGLDENRPLLSSTTAPEVINSLHVVSGLPRNVSFRLTNEEHVKRAVDNIARIASLGVEDARLNGITRSQIIAYERLVDRLGIRIGPDPTTFLGTSLHFDTQPNEWSLAPAGTEQLNSESLSRELQLNNIIGTASWFGGDSPGVYPLAGQRSGINTKLLSGSNGYTPTDAMHSVLLDSADDYKLFLIFFAKWLKNNKNSDRLLQQVSGMRAVSDILETQAPPGTKRFSDVQYVLSGHDIIENNIKASMSEMANNILLMTVKDLEVKEANENDSAVDGTSIWYVDEQKTEYRPFPNFTMQGVDFHPFTRPELRKQRMVIEKNATSDLQRAALLINHMTEAIKPMYRGHIKIIGRRIKPHDKVILFDKWNDMFGIIDVERVVHTFNMNDGWVTTLYPHAYTHACDQAQAVADRFDTSMQEHMLTASKWIGWLLDAALVISVIGAAFTAGQSLWGTAAIASAKAGLSATGKRFILKKALWKAATLGIGRGSTVSNKMVIRRIEQQVAAGTMTRAAANETIKNPALLAEMAKALTLESAAAAGSIASFVYGVGMETVKSSFFIGMRYLGYNALLKIARGVTGLWGMVSAEMALTGYEIPVHVFCLTKYGEPLQAGLDKHVTRYISWSERFGYNVDDMYRKIGNSFSSLFAAERSELGVNANLFRIINDNR